MSTSWIPKARSRSPSDPAGTASDATIDPIDTIGAPRIGIDGLATSWVRSRYRDDPTRTLAAYGLPATASLDELLTRRHGASVIDLVSDCDGVPVYPSAAMDLGFLATWVIDAGLLGRDDARAAYRPMSAARLRKFGREVRQRAEAYARATGCLDVLGSRVAMAQNVEDRGWGLSIVHRRTDAPYCAHVTYWGARWCEYWGRHGHGIDVE